MIEVDVWIRGRQDAAIEKIAGVSPNADSWTDSDVKKLIEGMLLALHRANDPRGVPPEVTLRGFSWIVSPDEGGVLLHLEMQLGTVSGGPFKMDEARLTEMIAKAKKAWHGVKLDQPDWGGGSHSIAFSTELKKEKLAFHLILNCYWEPLEFELPPAGGSWRRWIDTSLASPQDIVEWQSAPPVAGNSYRAGPRSDHLPTRSRARPAPGPASAGRSAPHTSRGTRSRRCRRRT